VKIEGNNMLGDGSRIVSLIFGRVNLTFKPRTATGGGLVAYCQSKYALGKKTVG
jgi:hypothetical protein